MRPIVVWISLIVFALVAAAGALGATAWKAQQQNKRNAAELTGGDADRGVTAVNAYGCGSCHSIPRIRSADARIGPPLDKIGTRAYVGGVVPNTPDYMVKWIQNAPSVDPMTAMPNLYVKEADARDIAAYLYTLR